MPPALRMKCASCGFNPKAANVIRVSMQAITATFLAGYAGASNERRGLVHRVGVAATLALAVYVIVELEYPRMGLVRVNSMDQALIELRTTMNSPIVGHVEQ